MVQIRFFPETIPTKFYPSPFVHTFISNFNNSLRLVILQRNQQIIHYTIRQFTSHINTQQRTTDLLRIATVVVAERKLEKPQTTYRRHQIGM